MLIVSCNCTVSCHPLLHFNKILHYVTVRKEAMSLTYIFIVDDINVIVGTV